MSVVQNLRNWENKRFFEPVMQVRNQRFTDRRRDNFWNHHPIAVNRSCKPWYRAADAYWDRLYRLDSA